MTATKPKTAGGGELTIDELQQKYQALNKRKIQAETNLDNARKQLELLKKEAREKYGTDDLVALQNKLAQMRAENEQKRRQYQADLEKIERQLASVEQQFETVAEQMGEPN